MKIIYCHHQFCSILYHTIYKMTVANAAVLHTVSLLPSVTRGYNSINACSDEQAFIIASKLHFVSAFLDNEHDNRDGTQRSTKEGKHEGAGTAGFGQLNTCAVGNHYCV